MGLARSTFYDEPEIQPIGEARLVEQIKAICAEWPAYGYRRVTAELDGEGRIVNHKKVMRLMKENGLTVRPRRRFVATTDSDHDGPIFPNLAKNIVPTNFNQLWVADITYIAIATGRLTKKKVQRRVIGGRDRDAYSSNVANHMADHTGHRRTCSSAGVRFASCECIDRLFRSLRIHWRRL